MSALFDGFWKEFQERIIMDVLRTDGKKDIDFKQFAEITAERVKSIAPEMYDGIFEAAVAQHGVENLVQK